MDRTGRVVVEPGALPGSVMTALQPRAIVTNVELPGGPKRKTRPKATAVVVAIRIRPLAEWIERYARSMPSLDGQPQVALIAPPGSRDARARDGGHKLYAFDHVFDPGNQEEIYDTLGRQCLDHALQGFNASVFAYGMTGSGKTHTMMGTPDDPGVIMRVCEGLFGPEFDGWSVEVSFLEIYNEQVIDLLSPTQLAPVQRGEAVRIKQSGGREASPALGRTFVASTRKASSVHTMKGLTVREHPQFGVYVEGLVRVAVTSAADIDQLLAQGTKMRAVASTNMNSTSSRSHAVVQLFVAEGSSGDKVAQLNLIDLAGSENAKRADTSGTRLKEGQNINKSLFVLGQCIAILAGADGVSDFAQRHGTGANGELLDAASARVTAAARYVPYRDSTLTWILKECLGGNSKTCMLCTLSADEANHEQSLSTLKYADHAKRIKTKPVVNEDTTKKVIRALQTEIKDLANELKQTGEHATLAAPLRTSFATQTAIGRMDEAQQLLATLHLISMTREEKLQLADKLNAQRKQMLLELGIAVDDEPVRTRREARESLARRSERDARASARDSTRSITQPTMLPPLPRRPAPFLTNLSADPQQTGKLVFYLKAGFTHIGREMAPEAALAPAVDAPTPRAAGSAKPKPQATAVGSAAPVVGAAHCIVLNSNAIRPRHARVHNANGVCSISPEVGAAVFINGKLLGSGWHADARVRGADESGDDDGEVELGSTSQGYVLEHGDRVILGSHHVFVFQHPSVREAAKATAAAEGGGEVGSTSSDGGEAIDATWEEAIAELEAKRSFDLAVLMFQAYLSDELGSLFDGEIELFTDVNALSDLILVDRELLGADAAVPTRLVTQALRTMLVVLAAANLWFEFFSLLSLQVIRPLELVISAEMLALIVLLLGGLTSVKVVLWSVPALMSNSTLVFLETLAGAYEASRSERSKQPLGQFFGFSLFVAGLVHAAWTQAFVRELVYEVLGTVLCLPPPEKRARRSSSYGGARSSAYGSGPYVRFEDDEYEDESSSGGGDDVQQGRALPRQPVRAPSRGIGAAAAGAARASYLKQTQSMRNHAC